MKRFVSFRVKLLIYFIVLIAFAILSSSAIYIMNYVRSMKETMVSNSRDIAYRMGINIDNDLGKYMGLLNSQDYARQLFELNEQKFASHSTIKHRNELTKMMDGIYFSFNNAYGMGFIGLDGESVCVGRTNLEEVRQVIQAASQNERVQNGNESWFQYRTGSGENVVVLYKKIVYVDEKFSPNAVGEIVVMLRENWFYNQYFQQTNSKYNQFYIVDGNGTIVSGINSDLVGQQYSAVYRETGTRVQDTWNAVFTKIEGESRINNWQYIYLLSDQEIKSNVRNVLGNTVFVFFILMLCAVILARVIAGQVSRPLVRLVHYMEKITKHEYDALPPLDQNDEIGLVYSSYNNMVSKLNEQINYNLAMEIKVRDAKIEAYEAQINPHFIYNTLQLIQMLSIMGKNEQVEEVSLKLGEILRFNLKGEKEIRIEKETANIENYFRILKLRYGDDFEYHISIPEELQQKYTLKFLLQPLVENAMKHGIENVNRKGVIWIWAKEIGNEIVMIVRDNGKGLQSDAVRELNARINETASDRIGLSNVNHRIKLFYGEKFGLEVYSEYNDHTDILVHIPSCDHRILEEEKGENDGV